MSGQAAENERRAKNEERIDAHGLISSLAGGGGTCPAAAGAGGGYDTHPGAHRPVERRNYTLEELQQFDGSCPGVAILVAVCGTIYDVSNRADLYGIGGPYSWIAGRDGSVALAKMHKLDPSDTTTLEELDEKQRKVLSDWQKLFERKYEAIGALS